MADKHEAGDIYEPVENPINQWEVASSAADIVYKIMTDGQNWSCTCLGYFYRGECRHIRTIKEQIEK
jgi:hypothetical protein